MAFSSSRLQLSLLIAVLHRARRDQRGQAMIESAIVMPLMVFLILGIIQLVMVQHAKIMTEYAAYNAARAGIVWNADRFIMENAAIISLMPTNDALFGENDVANPMQMMKRIAQRALLYQLNRRLPQAVELVKGAANKVIDKLPSQFGIQDKARDQVNRIVDAARAAGEAAAVTAIGQVLGSADDRMVRIDVLNPNNGMGTVNLPGLGNLPGMTGGHFGNTNQEIDFDDFGARSGTRLTIRLRYMYLMRIPFANWIIHSAWMAGQAGRQLYGAIWNPQARLGETGFRNILPAHPYDTAGQPKAGSALESRDLEVARVAGSSGTYLIPLYATYTMRMQSNPYRTSVQLQ